MTIKTPCSINDFWIALNQTTRRCIPHTLFIMPKYNHIAFPSSTPKHTPMMIDLYYFFDDILVLGKQCWHISFPFCSH
jgi:hypothetical protein